MKRLTKSGFKKWLESQEEGQFVGAILHPEKCPITNYCNHMEPECRHSTGGTSRRVFNGSGFLMGQIDLPEWARSFVIKVDHHTGGFNITREKALEILEWETND